MTPTDRNRLDFPPSTEPMSPITVYLIVGIVALTLFVIVGQLGRMIVDYALR